MSESRIEFICRQDADRPGVSISDSADVGFERLTEMFRAFALASGYSPKLVSDFMEGK